MWLRVIALCVLLLNAGFLNGPCLCDTANLKQSWKGPLNLPSSLTRYVCTWQGGVVQCHHTCSLEEV